MLELSTIPLLWQLRTWHLAVLASSVNKQTEQEENCTYSLLRASTSDCPSCNCRESRAWASFPIALVTGKGVWRLQSQEGLADNFTRVASRESRRLSGMTEAEQFPAGKPTPTLGLAWLRSCRRIPLPVPCFCFCFCPLPLPPFSRDVVSLNISRRTPTKPDATKAPNREGHRALTRPGPGPGPGPFFFFVFRRCTKQRNAEHSSTFSPEAPAVKGPWRQWNDRHNVPAGSGWN